MMKRMKSGSIILCIIVALLAAVMFGFNEKTAKAYNGIAGLTEQQLYNETNTYDVSVSCFNVDGSFNTTTDNNRITNTTQYNISYNMTTKQNCSVMNYAQITVLTHGLDSNASVWSNNFSASNYESIDFAYDSSSLITKISDQAGGANIYWAKMTV